MKLSELAKEGRGTLFGEDVEITSLTADSRVAGAGDLFFCIPGTRTDSHDFAKEAEERGAAAIVCERDTGVRIPQLVVPEAREGMARISAAFYGHPERKMKIIGITGTNGKTTVAHMLYSILSEAGRRAGIIGTLGARYASTFVPPALTTPDPTALFALLFDMQKRGVEYVVMEVSAHALALKKVEPILFELAIFTNLTQDHLDFFGDMASYGEAKRRLFLNMCREAILNADDAFSRTIEGGVPATSYGLECPADSFALIEHESLTETRILLNLEDDLIEARLLTTGRHNVYNALAAGVAAKKLGVRGEVIASGLLKVRVEGRLERVGSFHGADIFIDFAHTPDGIEKSLLSLRPHCKRRLIILFGCGGNRDRKKRSLMGERAARFADFAVLTSDNPRYEDPVSIISEIEAGFRKYSEQYVAVEEREQATKYAISLLQKGDILLIAGKGGETDQEIMGIKYSYNDKAIVKSILEKL
ncbi:MAG: UDP-N-acetylmuramoyl-L-alanyl-D-glutamate--2,6-diaminopimelate ligase [Clostridia bacterium]|nr:UDP-N-acetylmuramoyl-L-alanyl-D-glutamate--2,6-diaminopimelate ligase [Clostridia bacterium]